MPSSASSRVICIGFLSSPQKSRACLEKVKNGLNFMFLDSIKLFLRIHARHQKKVHGDNSTQRHKTQFL